MGRHAARRLALAAVPVLLLGACATGQGGDDGTDGDAELANPSAVFCEEQGGTYSLDDETCTLPDGSVVDAWDYYREQHSEQE